MNLKVNVIRKKLVKQLTKLDPKKTGNRLYAELVSLKFNIAASQLGKTSPASLPPSAWLICFLVQSHEDV